jgi:3-oxoacyl-[acyl-carrier protein] reductase
LIDFTGKVALVTGGSRGIGAATARLFAKAGGSVAISYHTRKDDAEKVVREIETGGKARAIAIQAELTDARANERCVAATLEAFGRLDAFVVNAGIWPPDPVALADMSIEQWRQTVATNLDSVFYGCRAAAPALKEGGAVVIISSTAGQRGEAFHADYAATKGAAIALVKSLAVELAPRVTVNCVAPGWVDTEMAAPALKGVDRSKVEATIPLRRLASADDIAGPIVFLCSPLARHITGEILNVNGGSVLCG